MAPTRKPYLQPGHHGRQHNDVPNHSEVRRDFTYIDHIAEGFVCATEILPERSAECNRLAFDLGTSASPNQIYNIGSNQPARLLDTSSIPEWKLAC